jgi:hypothetical protein
LSFLNAAEKEGSITKDQIKKNIELQESIGLNSYIEDQKKAKLRERQQLYNRWLELKRELYQVEKKLNLTTKSEEIIEKEPEIKKVYQTSPRPVLKDGKWVFIDSEEIV